MKSIKVDKNYNFVDEVGIYETELSDTVGMIISAKQENVITDTDAQFLINLVISKEIKKEVKNALPLRKGTEIRSLFMNMKSNEIKHV